ncbi:uncharacterized protein JNUCC1_00119 [Lentibacillus sp. JNUCC-1]|uniref:VanW family protein n=1 Tax=Lentibacillus sp. JNUCC-1 TaxID=2654513 RepID=UPI0013238300|nr:VanW family protein [Lentibacillus sp. JNUCC-1]MUV36318.1 uncharacterized protein [Lentibacillus sp. JNUCC-1]
MKQCLAVIIIIMIFPAMSVAAEEIDLIYEDEPVETIHRDYFFLEGSGGLIFDQKRMYALYKKIQKRIYTSPKNARITSDDEISSEIPGIQVHELNFRQMLMSHLLQKDASSFEIPTERIYPRVDSELLNQIRTIQLGEYRTHFEQSHTERSHNIELAAQAINNYVVFPGETFSFNRIVGERTEEKGYKRAPVIVKGELTEGIGGGICQVSSTLFNAVDLRGVQIVERYSHSRQVPYVPSGRDAAVSWWGPDFVFKNKYSQPILILAEAHQGNLYIRIMSSENIKNK